MNSLKTIRKAWSAEEDASLLDLISKHCAVGCWPQIGLLMESRTGKQCKERYINHLDPDVNRSAWMKCEDHILRTLYLKHGTKWSLYMPHLSGRSDNAIKNRYHVISRYAEEVLPSETVHKRSFCDSTTDEEGVILVPILLCSSEVAAKRIKCLLSAREILDRKIRELEEGSVLLICPPSCGDLSTIFNHKDFTDGIANELVTEMSPDLNDFTFMWTENDKFLAKESKSQETTDMDDLANMAFDFSSYDNTLDPII